MLDAAPVRAKLKSVSFSLLGRIEPAPSARLLQAGFFHFSG
jgi:hypothetical protein